MNDSALAAGGIADEPEILGSERQQYLTFRIDNESFAIGILAIKEILEYSKPTAVPLMPACVRGVINLRGQVVPIVDLSLRFGRAAADAGRRTCFVIVEMSGGDENQDVGIIVDAVHQVLEIPAQNIEPAPGFGTRLRADFIAGMGKIDNGFVIILNTDRVLAIEDLAQHAQDAGRDG